MKHSALRKTAVTLCVIVCSVFFITGNAAAQCSYKAVNLRNDTLSVSVPCDFPVKAHSSDTTKDKADFTAAFTVWNKSAVSSRTLPTASFSGIKNVFFEIPANSFDAMSDERKNAMLLYPELYIKKN